MQNQQQETEKRTIERMNMVINNQELQQADFNNINLDQKGPNGNTILMLLAQRGRDLPTLQNGQYTSCIQNDERNTAAMIFAANDAYRNKDIPSYLLHNTNMQDKKGKTVAMILIDHGRVPQDIWCNYKDIKDMQGRTLYDYVYNQHFEDQGFMLKLHAFFEQNKHLNLYNHEEQRGWYENACRNYEAQQHAHQDDRIPQPEM